MSSFGTSALQGREHVRASASTPTPRTSTTPERPASPDHVACGRAAQVAVALMIGVDLVIVLAMSWP